jgi:hypothetical protein
MVGSGSPDSTASTIFTEFALSMGTEDLFQTIIGIRRRGELAQSILEEDAWEIPWQICPVQQEDLVPVRPITEHLQF